MKCTFTIVSYKYILEISLTPLVSVFPDLQNLSQLSEHRLEVLASCKRRDWFVEAGVITGAVICTSQLLTSTNSVPFIGAGAKIFCKYRKNLMGDVKKLRRPNKTL